jgi:hypothetical protein
MKIRLNWIIVFFSLVHDWLGYDYFSKLYTNWPVFLWRLTSFLHVNIYLFLHVISSPLILSSATTKINFNYFVFCENSLFDWNLRIIGLCKKYLLINFFFYSLKKRQFWFFVVILCKFHFKMFSFEPSMLIHWRIQN